MIFIKSRPFIIIITEVSEFQNAGIAKVHSNAFARWDLNMSRTRDARTLKNAKITILGQPVAMAIALIL